MISAGLNFHLLAQDLLLLPEKAIFWQQQKALILADVHLGKTGHFRKAGIAVPAQVGHEDLNCLNKLINLYQPEKIIFLGDLFHSDMNNDWHHFADWRRQHSAIHMQLVIGNHDIIKEQHYHDLDVSTHRELQTGPFLMLHHPQNNTCLEKHEHYIFCGHIHPGVKMLGKGRQSVTLPCFAFSQRQAILPSFGKFTGRVDMRHHPNDKVFAVLERNVFAV